MTNILSFASAIYDGSEKESIAININIVKPIPANKPTPMTCNQLAPSGRELSFIFTHKKDVSKIPIGFPINNPNPIPKPKLEVSPLIISDSRVMFVFANANKGMMKKL